MRSYLHWCDAAHPRQRRHATATLSGLFALLALALVTATATATAAPVSTRPSQGTAAPHLATPQVQAAVVQLPVTSLSTSGLLSTLPLGGLLGLTPEEVLSEFSPDELSAFLGHLTETVTPTQIQKLLASLAGDNLSGEEATALSAIVGALTQGLSSEQLAQLRTDLASLPTGLSAGELAALDPAQLATVLDGLFATASPTELTPVVSQLLGGLTWGTGTTESLAEGLGVPVATLASVLGEAGASGFSGLPVVTSELGSTGQVVGLVDRTRGLALGLLAPEEAQGEGEGGEEAHGGAGEGSGTGEGGSGAGEGEGSAGNGSGSGSAPGGSGAGGSGSGSGGNGGSGGSGLPGSGLTVTITLPPTPTPASAGATASAAAPKTTQIKVLSHRVRGRVATIVLQAPSAGTLVLSGPGVRTTTAKLRSGGRVTLTASLSQARIASLRRTRHHLRVVLKAAFKPTAGSSSSATATVTFA